MILIFGGAYQGKLEFAREKFFEIRSINEKDICFCNEEDGLDYEKKVIYGLEKYILGQVRRGISEKEILDSIYDERLNDRIIICTDISQGIVPLKKEQRFARETTGRAMVGLGKRAESVYRVFCGLSQQLK